MTGASSSEALEVELAWWECHAAVLPGCAGDAMVAMMAERRRWLDVTIPVAAPTARHPLLGPAGELEARCLHALRRLVRDGLRLDAPVDEDRVAEAAAELDVASMMYAMASTERDESPA